MPTDPPRTSPRATRRPNSGGDALPIERHVFFWLTQLVNRRNQALSQALAPLGSTVAKWRVLNTLQQAPGLSMGQLAERTAVDRTTLTRTVDRLEDEGLLSRGVVPDNRRVLALSLTDRGRALLQSMLPLVRDQNRVALEGISADETAALIATLRKMIANLGAAAPEGDPL